LLAPAALDAVRQRRYKPYLLNNEPVEVDTQIDVNFTLGRAKVLIHISNARNVDHPPWDNKSRC
jgi:hypothetical protein